MDTNRFDPEISSLSKEDPKLTEQLTASLTEQDRLKEEFSTATPADSYKDEIELDPHYIEVTTIKMTPENFLVQHIPTEILKRFSVMTGPRHLKNGIMVFVDNIENNFPPKNR